MGLFVGLFVDPVFITELYLRNRVSDHYVSASSRPTGLRLSHGESMIQLPSLLLNASVLPCGTRNLTISLKCLVQSILVYDNDRPRGYNEFFWMIFFNVDFRCWFSMLFPMLIYYVGFQCCFYCWFSMLIFGIDFHCWFSMSRFFQMSFSE